MFFARYIESRKRFIKMTENLVSKFERYRSNSTESYVDSYDKVEGLIRDFEKDTRSRFVCTKRPAQFGKKGTLM